MNTELKKIKTNSKKYLGIICVKVSFLVELKKL